MKFRCLHDLQQVKVKVCVGVWRILPSFSNPPFVHMLSFSVTCHHRGASFYFWNENTHAKTLLNPDHTFKRHLKSDTVSSSSFKWQLFFQVNKSRTVFPHISIWFKGVTCFCLSIHPTLSCTLAVCGPQASSVKRFKTQFIDVNAAGDNIICLVSIEPSLHKYFAHEIGKYGCVVKSNK